MPLSLPSFVRLSCKISLVCWSDTLPQGAQERTLAYCSIVIPNLHKGKAVVRCCLLKRLLAHLDPPSLKFEINVISLVPTGGLGMADQTVDSDKKFLLPVCHVLPDKEMPFHAMWQWYLHRWNVGWETAGFCCFCLCTAWGFVLLGSSCFYWPVSTRLFYHVVNRAGLVIL